MEVGTRACFVDGFDDRGAGGFEFCGCCTGNGPDGTIQYIDKQINVRAAGEAVVAKLKELGVKEKK